VPHEDLGVLTRTGEQPPVRRVGDSVDFPRVTDERLHGPPVLDVPEYDTRICAPTGQLRSGRAERDCIDEVSMAGKCLGELAGLRVPQKNPSLLTGTCHEPTVCTRRNGCDGMLMAPELQSLLATCHVPRSDGRVPSDAEEALPVRAEDDTADQSPHPVLHRQTLPAGRIPEANHAILARAGDERPIGTDGEGGHALFLECVARRPPWVWRAVGPGLRRSTDVWRTRRLGLGIVRGGGGRPRIVVGELPRSTGHGCPE